MKKLFTSAIVCLLVSLSAKCTFAQTLTDNYTNPSLWTFVPASTTGNSCTSASGNSLVINGTSYPGKCAFYQMNGQAGSDCRVYRPLGFYLSNTWTAQFDYELTSLSGNGVAVFPIVFTAGTQAIQVTPSQVLTNQDAIGVVCNNTINVTSPRWVEVWIKSGTATTASCQVNINLNTPYRIILKRLSKTEGTFSVYDITTGTPVLVQSCCFPIPASLPDLGYVQTGSDCQAGDARDGNGWVTNLSVTNTDISPCCNATDINGTEEIQICSQTTQATYCVNSSVQSGVAFNWIVPSGITYNVIDSGTCINVTNWGTNIGLVPISVWWQCNCTIDTLTRDIPVHADLANYTGFTIDTSSSGSIMTITCNPTIFPLPAGATEYWEIFKAANCTGTDTTTTGPVLDTATTSTFVATNLSVNSCYIIIRTIKYNDGICRPVVQKGKAGRGLTSSLITFPINAKSEPKVYPNPTPDIINIELPVTSDNIKEIEIIDMLGNIVLSKEVNNKNNIQLSTKDLSSGIYSIKFTGDNYSNSIKLVKN